MTAALPLRNVLLVDISFRISQSHETLHSGYRRILEVLRHYAIGMVAAVGTPERRRRTGVGHDSYCPVHTEHAEIRIEYVRLPNSFG